MTNTNGRTMGALLACCILLSGSGEVLSQTYLEVNPFQPFMGVGFARGPVTPAQTSYCLSNAGPDTLTWTTVKSAPWFSVSETAGVLAPGETRDLLLFPNSLAVELPVGNHESSLVWVNQTHGESIQIPVQIEKTLPEPGKVEVLDVTLRDALDLSFSGKPGEAYLIESTQDFLEWSLVHSNVFVGETASYREALNEATAKFFRVQYLGEDALPSALSLTNVVVQDPRSVRLSGEVGGTYLIELTTNQVVWSPFSTNQVPAEGFVNLSNLMATDQETVSYRATGVDVFPAPVVRQVLLIGQSLAAGVNGSPVLSEEESAVHYRFVSEGSNTFVRPLRELGVETIMSSSANQVSLLATNHRLAMSFANLPGADYDQLKKGTATYARGVKQFRDAAVPLAGVLRGYRPSALFAVHGEADHLNPDYDLNVREWQADFERDIRNVTGHEVNIPMFHSQVSTWPRFGAMAGSPTTVGAFELLAESIAHPDKTILVCPKYMFTYGDGIHMTNSSYRWLGEYYGKVYRKVVVEQQPWSPLRPLAVGRTNNIITVRFHVPVPPLVLDTDLVSNPGRMGFEYWNNGGAPPSIIGVRLTGPDTVELGIAGLPSNVNERLRYAYTGVPGNFGGPLTGPRGNLRDSDPEPSAHGNTLYNWCVHFDEPIATATSP